MLDLSSKNIELFCVADTNIEESIKAINYCLKNTKFKSVKLLTSKRNFKNLDSQVEVIKIKPISTIQEYSKFMIFDAINYIDAKYILTIQYDGIIVNPKKWTNDFLKYDYIGGPWQNQVVGNSGFCLRSKRFLKIVIDNSRILKKGYFPDDVILSRLDTKKALMRFGIKYAPYELACRFSSLYGTKVKEIVSFGIHNKVLSKKILSDKY